MRRVERLHLLIQRRVFLSCSIEDGNEIGVRPGCIDELELSKPLNQQLI
jgi:hypothetical protein